MPDLLRSALQQIAQENVDLLAITGDLLDVPSWLMEPAPGFVHDDSQPWHDAALADYKLLKAMLDDAGLRYTVLPGNHDLPRSMWRVFDPTEDVIDVAGHRVLRFCDYEHAGHTPRRFIPQRTHFEEALDAADSPPQIHLQHYVIAPAIPGDYPMNYAEHAYLTRRLAASKVVRLCLSGHYHAGTEPQRVGSTVFAVTPAFSDWPHPWRIYEIDDKGV